MPLQGVTVPCYYLVAGRHFYIPATHIPHFAINSLKGVNGALYDVLAQRYYFPMGQFEVVDSILSKLDPPLRLCGVIRSQECDETSVSPDFDELHRKEKTSLESKSPWIVPPKAATQSSSPKEIRKISVYIMNQQRYFIDDTFIPCEANELLAKVPTIHHNIGLGRWHFDKLRLNDVRNILCSLTPPVIILEQPSDSTSVLNSSSLAKTTRIQNYQKARIQEAITTITTFIPEPFAPEANKYEHRTTSDIRPPSIGNVSQKTVNWSVLISIEPTQQSDQRTTAHSEQVAQEVVNKPAALSICNGCNNHELIKLRRSFDSVRTNISSYESIPLPLSAPELLPEILPGQLYPPIPLPYFPALFKPTSVDQPEKPVNSDLSGPKELETAGADGLEPLHLEELAYSDVTEEIVVTDESNLHSQYSDNIFPQEEHPEESEAPNLTLTETVAATHGSLDDVIPLNYMNSEDTLLEQLIKTLSRIPPEATKLKVRQILEASVDNGIVAEIPTLTVSLKCILGKNRMKTPSRGLHCDHYVCFDAWNFFKIYEKSVCGKCPICDSILKADDLRIDGFFEMILSALPMDVDEVWIDSSGNFGGPTDQPHQNKAAMQNASTDDEDVEDVADKNKRKKRKWQGQKGGTSSKPSHEGPIVITLDDDDDDDDDDYVHEVEIQQGTRVKLESTDDVGQEFGSPKRARVSFLGDLSGSGGETSDSGSDWCENQNPIPEMIYKSLKVRKLKRKQNREMENGKKKNTERQKTKPTNRKEPVVRRTLFCLCKKDCTHVRCRCKSNGLKCGAKCHPHAETQCKNCE